MLALVVLAAPVLFYLLPASLPLWRPFLICWGTLAMLLAAAWLAPFFYQAPQDQLARMIDDALRAIFSACWMMAGFVQLLRGMAGSRGYSGYMHWLGVTLGAAVIIVVGAGFL